MLLMMLTMLMLMSLSVVERVKECYFAWGELKGDRRVLIVIIVIIVIIIVTTATTWYTAMPTSTVQRGPLAASHAVSRLERRPPPIPEIGQALCMYSSFFFCLFFVETKP